MGQDSRTLKRTEFGMVLILTLVALALRLGTALSVSMPLNDGGLFYSMITDLIHHDFSLPVLTTYNGGLPYAYPPLAFFLTGLISNLTGIAVIDLLRILPAIISACAIPLFHRLSTRLCSSPTQALLATLLFSTVPMAFLWQVMGGGITRSLGQVFALLALAQAHDFFKAGSFRSGASLAVFGALTVMTHPEAALQVALAAAVWLVLLARSAQAVGRLLVIGVGALLLSAPWWGVQLARFGSEPFIAVFTAASQDSLPLAARLVLPFQLNLTEEPYITIVACLGVIGFFVAFGKKQVLLPVWFLIALLVDTRSGMRYATLPLSMLGGLALSAVVFPALSESHPAAEGDIEQALLGGRTRRLFFGYLFIILLAGSFFALQSLAAERTMSPAETAAAGWLQTHTPVDARLAAITGAQPLLDPLNEWLPALSGRRVVSSAFGREWAGAGQFGPLLQGIRDLQACTAHDTACLDTWMKMNGRVDYFMIKKSLPGRDDDLPLRVWLLHSPNYSLVYDSEKLSIFKAIQPKE